VGREEFMCGIILSVQSVHKRGNGGGGKGGEDQGSKRGEGVKGRGDRKGWRQTGEYVLLYYLSVL